MPAPFSTFGLAAWRYSQGAALPDILADQFTLIQDMDRMSGAGIGYAATNAARTALVTASQVFAGYLVYDAQDDFVYKWNGTGWVGGNKVQHAEFTSTSASVATGTTAAVGTLTVDATKSNLANAFCTPGASLVTFNEAGIYSIDVVGTIPANPTGIFLIRGTDAATNQYGIYGSTAASFIGAPLATGLVAAAGDTFTLAFQHNSAASRVLTLRTKVTKLGNL